MSSPPAPPSFPSAPSGPTPPLPSSPAKMPPVSGAKLTAAEVGAEAGDDVLTWRFLKPKSGCTVQPFFFEKSRIATFRKVFQIGLCGVVEADLDVFCNCWSAGFLGERLCSGTSPRYRPVDQTRSLASHRHRCWSWATIGLRFGCHHSHRPAWLSPRGTAGCTWRQTRARAPASRPADPWPASSRRRHRIGRLGP